MMTTLRLVTFGLALLWIMAGCQSQPGTRTVKLTIQNSQKIVTDVQLDTLDVISLENLVVAQSKLDSTGSTLLEFELPRTLFTRLKLGDSFHTLYLSPGDELIVRYDTAGNNVRFEGASAIENRYLAQTALIWQQSGLYQNGISAEMFMTRLDSTKNKLSDVKRHYLDSTSLSASTSALFDQKEELGILMAKQFYYWNNYFAAGNKEAPKAIGSVWQEIPFDSTLLRTAMPSYASVLYFYLYMYKYPSLYPKGASKSTVDSINKNFPFLAYEKIKEASLSPAFHEFFQAKILDYSLASDGITPAIDSFYTQFKRRYPSSEYRQSVENQYQKWAALLPGKVAPDIRGITVDGKEFALSDLRGKVVYVDVWATWCGPCRSEFPYSKKIKKRFEGDDRVAFLYVSVDREADQWKKYLQKNRDLEGIHINQNPDSDETSSIYKKYMIWGIPRYFLIDQQGKIVSIMAAKPSSGEVEKEIRKVLAQPTPLASL
jgi:thiol-disulfide isomerase/thioredoxin